MSLMKVFNVYTFDFFICVVYILFSYSLCLITFFNYTEVLFLFEVHPLVGILSTKRFILTQITQLFNSIWFFNLTTSTIFIYPLFMQQFRCFLSPGWYKFQIKLYDSLTAKNLFLFILFYFLIHLYLIPNVLNFFLYWEISDEYSLLRIEAEISFYLYVLWLITFKLTLTVISIIFIKLFIFGFYIININLIYFSSKKFRKIFTFSSISFLFLLTPPEVITQILLTFFIYLLVELFYFYICIKYLIKNAYTKTNIKKTS